MRKLSRKELEDIRKALEIVIGLNMAVDTLPAKVPEYLNLKDSLVKLLKKLNSPLLIDRLTLSKKELLESYKRAEANDAHNKAGRT